MLDCSELVNEIRNSKTFKEKHLDMTNCLNGIAYDAQTDTLLVTGKNWPFIYQIELKQRYIY